MIKMNEHMAVARWTELGITEIQGTNPTMLCNQANGKVSLAA